MTTKPPAARDANDLVIRLRRIEGQVRGLQHMVENDANPLDTVIQLTAIRGALAAVSSAILAAEVTRLAPLAPSQDLAGIRRSVRLLTDR